jgi:hypothetical protein
VLQRKPVTELKGTTVITHHFEAVLEVRHTVVVAVGGAYMACTRCDFGVSCQLCHLHTHVFTTRYPQLAPSSTAHMHHCHAHYFPHSSESPAAPSH